MSPDDLRYQAKQKRDEAYELDKSADTAEQALIDADQAKVQAEADAEQARVQAETDAQAASDAVL